MEKSGVIVGGALGATVVLIIFAFVISPPESISPPTPELVVSNGHGVSTVGEITPLPSKKDLTLIEIFEHSEASVVRVNVQRDIEVISTSGVGSGFSPVTNNASTHRNFFASLINCKTSCLDIIETFASPGSAL